MKINKLPTGKKPKFSITLLIVFVSIFMLAGVYIIYRSLAAITFDIVDGTVYTPSGKVVERIWGPNRYTTAVAISKEQFPTTTGGTVIIASGNAWPDATSGSVLARSYNAPLLLTNPSSLNSYTEAEIKRLAPKRVIIIGGTLSVSSAVESRVKLIRPSAIVERIAGANRYESAAKIGNRIYQLNGGKINDNTAIVVTGGNFSDAIAVGSVAATKKYPILYVSTSLPVETKSALSRLGIRRTLVVGGTASIPDTVKNQLPGAIRIAGSDRYQTSINFIDWSTKNLTGLSFSTLGVATGATFPDGLAASSFIASRPGLLVLSSYNIGSNTKNYINAKKTSVKRIYVFGGELTLSSTTFMTLANIIGSDFTAKQIEAQKKVDRYIKYCPILAGTTADYGDTQGNYQAISYYKSGRIIINPKHTVSLDRIIDHEIYHIYDW
ncbi:cell wall-binding repeat-containing protein, partial [Patescibacteria group bacterium]|nr:cell wall-binding repeat-containing protein [Patescibacteria group bacterium]